MQRFELLAPAGSLASLKAAVNAGADAVYIGGSMFGARAYADNPETDELVEGIRYCHLRGRCLYMTVNTLFKNDELEQKLIPFLKPYYEAGLDAVIVQDLGAMELISKAYPDLPIHISTQAAITMAEAANALKDRFPSVTRVVPARELSLDEIARFRRETTLEMEVFVHGALCYSCSGQCLLSSMIGGRSGNRGRCAQPCRKMYDGKYLLSPKDQCLLRILHELMDIGVDSFKIEGRMKSPEYTAGVVSIYRKWIDRYIELGSKEYLRYIENHSKELEKDIDFLKELYNRGGFNEGYLHSYNGPEMMTFDRPNHSGLEVGEVITVRGREAVIKFSSQVFAQDVIEIRDSNEKCFEFTLGQGFDKGETYSAITMKGHNAARGMKVFRTRCNEILDEIDVKYVNAISKVRINGIFTAKKGEPFKLTFENSSNGSDVEKSKTYSTAVTVTGQIAEASKNSSADEEQVRKQLNKLGETPFEFENLIVDIVDGLFIPSGALNNMRREAVAALEEAIDRKYQRKDSQILPENDISDRKTVAENAVKKVYSVWTSEQFNAVIEGINPDEQTDLYFNMSSFKTDVISGLYEKCNRNISVYIGLPYISRASVLDKLKVYVEEIHESYPKTGFLARTREEMAILDKLGYHYRTDYNLYGMNRRALNYLPDEYTLPQELNENELGIVTGDGAEMIIYGFQPVMFSAQCVYKNKFGKCRGVEGTDFTSFTDELGHDFRARQLCAFCTNVIYNSARLDLTDRIDGIAQMAVGRVRFDFTFESADEIRDVMSGKPAGKGEHCTNGHFLRGIM